LPQIKIAFPKAIVHSFDLISLHESIITADMTQLPIDNSQCDFAVFSLSLMATNISDCLSEANRILKTNGRLIIVEVLSRFDGKEESFAKIMSKFGFELNNKQLLPPNSYFIYFEFNKLKNCKKNGLPNVTLKPCVYKPR
jgi:ribosomal RNA-processing protein 8